MLELMMVNLPFDLTEFNSGIKFPYHANHTLFIALKKNIKYYYWKNTSNSKLHTLNIVFLRSRLQPDNVLGFLETESFIVHLLYMQRQTALYALKNVKIIINETSFILTVVIFTLWYYEGYVDLKV